ncbi:glycosyltransferase, partial [Phocaeicola sp.]
MFSVLISVYNKENSLSLRQSLTSVFRQKLPPTEVVLLKDGPLTEELDKVIAEYVMRYPELKIVSLPVNQGLGKALNEGLKHCSYDLVARMDTDDIAKPDRFEKQIRVFQEHPELDVVGAWIDEFEETTSNII